MRPETRADVRPLDLVWTAFAVAMLAVMWFTDFGMTIPYHLIFVSFALVYGFRLWPGRVASIILGAITVLTGVIFLREYLSGLVELDELAEVPLMPLIVSFMVWHGLRRVAAQREVEALAALERSRVQRQREFLRDTSHAIRTPVTIALGHVELLRLGSDDPSINADAEEVVHQLKRLGDLARRLLTMETLDTTGGLHRELVDLGEFVARIGHRWEAAVPRRWVVDVSPSEECLLAVDRVRLEESLDALLENAVRFTTENDVVRISARGEGDAVVLEVADTGPGIPAGETEHVFDRFFHRTPPGGQPGTGLGLALVQSVARAHGGSATAGTAPEGGALLQLRLPRHAASTAVVAELIPGQLRPADVPSIT